MAQKPAKTQFVLLSTHRSGSTYLYSLLSKHPEIDMHGEIFTPSANATYYNVNLGSFKTRKIVGCAAKMYNHLFLRGTNNLTGLHQFIWNNITEILYRRFADPQHFFRRMLESVNPKLKATGFKMLMLPESPNSQDPPPYLSVMKTVLCAPHLKVILLTRENVLRRYISKEVASLSGVWDMNVKDGGKSDKAEKIENAYKKMNFSVEEFYKYLARNDSVKAFAKEYLRQGPQECVELTYEQIFGKDRDKKLAQIWKLLGVSKPRKPLEGNTKHMNPQPLSEIVVNYDEMCKALKGTPYEKMAKG